MKTSLSRFLLVGALLLAPLPSTFAIVGYVNRSFTTGDNLFANPLRAGDNTISNLFVAAPVPDGTTISLWNPATASYDTTSTFDAFTASWSINLLLAPGTGARLTTSSGFANVFLGEVLNHNGTFLGVSDPFVNPPLYAGPNGLLLLGDKAPMVNTGNDIFLHLIGRDPNVGEQVITLTTTSTYLGGGDWDILPTLGVSDAAFLNVGPVPEPGTATLTLLGITLLAAVRRKP
jgi:hypothetical protein